MNERELPQLKRRKFRPTWTLQQKFRKWAAEEAHRIYQWQVEMESDFWGYVRQTARGWVENDKRVLAETFEQVKKEMQVEFDKNLKQGCANAWEKYEEDHKALRREQERWRENREGQWQEELANAKELQSQQYQRQMNKHVEMSDAIIKKLEGFVREAMDLLVMYRNGETPMQKTDTFLLKMKGEAF